MHTNWTPLPAHITGPVRELTEQLRALKDSSGLTLTELGARTHYARSSWERWFNGKRLITRSALTSLASAMAIDGAPLLELLEQAETAVSEGRERRDGPDGPGSAGSAGGSGSGQAGGNGAGAGPLVVADGSPVVAQLPVAVIDFAGRGKHIRALCQALTTRDRGPGQTPIAVLTGAGGMGKTTLAVHVAHLLAESFPDGQFFVDLHGMDAAPLDPARVLHQWLLDVGSAPEAVPETLEARAARFRSLVAGRRFLIVLDNAHDAAQVRPLLPASEGCAVVVTSRSMLSGLAGVEHFGLTVLPPEEGRELFSKIVGDTRTSAEPDAATEIVRLCAGLPLGIRIAATRLAARPGWPISDIAGRLTAEHRRLAELATEELAVRASFRLSYDGLAGTWPTRSGCWVWCPRGRSGCRRRRRCSGSPGARPSGSWTRWRMGTCWRPPPLAFTSCTISCVFSPPNSRRPIWAMPTAPPRWSGWCAGTRRLCRPWRRRSAGTGSCRRDGC